MDEIGKLGSPELREKASRAKEGIKRLRKRLGLPSPLRAIRLNCLDCCGTSDEVRKCDVEKCNLWLYRFGRSPRESDLTVLEFDHHGNVIGEHKYGQK